MIDKKPLRAKVTNASKHPPNLFHFCGVDLKTVQKSLTKSYTCDHCNTEFTLKNFE